MLSSLAAATLAAGCGFDKTANPLTPSASGTPSYVGTWTSSSGAGPAANACGNFEWRISNQTDTLISGLFTARCAGNLAVSGSASGQLNGTTAPVTAIAGAIGPGITACEVSIAGPATLDRDTIRIPYSGTTCLGTVSGVEVLQRH
jgi:hypothetical protein